MPSIDVSFSRIAVMTDAIYRVADMADLSSNYAAQQDVADALERIVEAFAKELAELQGDHSDGG